MNLLERIRGALRRGGYDPGDRVSAAVKDAEGVERRTEFQVEAYCGGGFAGQVYRARCLSAESGWLPADQVYALKFFSPRSGFRRLFRDVLYRLCFISPFAYQYNEDSVRAGLYLTKLLQIVCQVMLGTARPINEFYGTFWDEHVGAFAELNEWVQGGVTEPAVDPEIFVRRAHNRRVRAAMRAGTAGEADLRLAQDEMSQKRRFMAFLCRMCATLGLDDLARQVYWWTGVSQPNVLTRRDGTHPGPDADFVWVDRRPGLPGLLLSAGDIPLLARAILRGSIPPFDRINFRTLRAWPDAPDRRKWDALVDRLEETDQRYRRTQVDPWHHHVQLFGAALRRDIALGFVDYWHRTGCIDDATRAALERGRPFLFTVHALVGLVPFVGHRLHQWVGNAAYRQHVRRFLREGAYRRDYFEQRRASSVKTWLTDGRTTERRAGKCLDSFPCFFTDRILCGWMPPAWQMFLTDWKYQADLWRRFFTSPFRYVFVSPYRRQVNTDWVRARTAEDVKRGLISPADAEEFVRVAGHKSIQQYITGMLFVVTMRSEWIYLLLGVFGVQLAKHYQVHASHLTVTQKLVAVAVALLVSPGGILRFLYCLVMGVLHRDVPYATAAIMAPIRAVGDLSFAAQAAKTHPGFSSYLLSSTTLRLAEHMPVFGERGGLLSVWVVTLMLSWPASLKVWWKARAKGKAML